MIEVTGDLWTYPADARVVPTNGELTRNGRLVMGAGVAKYCRDHYHNVDLVLGEIVAAFGSNVYFLRRPEWPDECIISFPTKHHWRDPSDPALVEHSADQLVELTDKNPAVEQVVLPRVGCGLGGLDWETVVKPILVTTLDDRFHVITPKG